MVRYRLEPSGCVPTYRVSSGGETVLATSRVGKVAAATTATHLIEVEQVEAIIFLGVAGAIDPSLSQGDIVIGDQLVQYDLDSRPLIPQFTVPLLNQSLFASDPALVAAAEHAAELFLLSKPDNQLLVGLIGTADCFVTDRGEKEHLREALPGLLAVDMEGAAVAQVCYEHGIPFVVIRTISDSSDGDAAVECMQFLEERASTYTYEVLRRFYDELEMKGD